MDASKLTPGQRAYEEKRARRAGMSLDSWLRDKDRRLADESRPAATAAKPGREPGLLARLMERARKPL